MPRLIVLIFCAAAFSAAGALPAAAQEPASDGLSLSAAAAASAAAAEAAPQTAAPPKVAFEYSDGYRLRAKIHKVSSLATLPLFGTEAIVGQSLYSDPTSGKKDAHLIAAAGIGALFAVNSATGVWNLIEARKDPTHRGRRLLHGLMMLGADAGFLATAALGPESEGDGVSGSRGTHRAVAFTSIGLATTSYLIMLFGGH
jgi:hypothetical protein